MIRISLLATLACIGGPAGGAAADLSPRLAAASPITPPPPALVERLGLSPFYKKHLCVGGLPILTSDKVSDYALREAAFLIATMLQGHGEVLEAMVENKVRFSIMATGELTTAIPEHSDLKPKKYWDRRARGLGATPERPAVSCGEENLLGYPGDPYATENILIHEFAHAMHAMGFNSVDPQFDTELKAIYDKAMEQGLWEGKYAASNHHEYFAEAVQSWFDTNRKPDHDHNHVDTRAELEEYDPAIAAFVGALFGDGDWRYQHPGERTGDDRGHLEGYDPGEAPTFAWPEKLDEWYRYHQRPEKAGGR